MDQEGNDLLITIEGIDGSGKSTLISGLAEELADLSPVFTREPGATWVGDAVRRAIAEEADPVAEALLFAADHAAHLSTVIRPALAAGRLVISDRYTDSRYAYQSVSLEGLVPDPVRWLREVHAGWSVPPDRTYLLLLTPAAALGRKDGKTPREHFEEESVLARVQEAYLTLARGEPGRFVLVDAEEEPGVVLSAVAAGIRETVLSSRSRRRG